MFFSNKKPPAAAALRSVIKASETRKFSRVNPSVIHFSAPSSFQKSACPITASAPKAGSNIKIVKRFSFMKSIFVLFVVRGSRFAAGI
jgi:hypothetical protein